MLFISNFKNRNGEDDKEKQIKYQNYLCLCLISYCKEGKNDANVSPESIYKIFYFIQQYYIDKNKIYENGLLCVSRLALVYSICEEKTENLLELMIS